MKKIQNILLAVVIFVFLFSFSQAEAKVQLTVFSFQKIGCHNPGSKDWQNLFINGNVVLSSRQLNTKDAEAYCLGKKKSADVEIISRCSEKEMDLNATPYLYIMKQAGSSFVLQAYCLKGNYLVFVDPDAGDLVDNVSSASNGLEKLEEDAIIERIGQLEAEIEAIESSEGGEEEDYIK